MINPQITNSAFIDGILGNEKCYHKIGNSTHRYNYKSYTYYIQEYDKGFVIGRVENKKRKFY